MQACLRLADIYIHIYTDKISTLDLVALNITRSVRGNPQIGHLPSILLDEFCVLVF